jgi:ABC-type multidrug transport system ATPase subunit
MTGSGDSLVRPTDTQVGAAAGARVVLGRADDCDIVFDDVLVSRHHAQLLRLPDGTLQLEDLGSHNGTFVNGTPQRQVVLRVGDVVSFGRHRLRLGASGLLEEFKPTGGARFTARGLKVTAPSGATLLDGIEVALEGSSFLGVVGPSGAGKSTLLGALTGLRPAGQGTVLVGGHDLYAEYELVRHDIGFVPQDDVLHPELTVRQALSYAAELRFPPDVGKDERLARVDEVIVELGLERRRDLRIAALSGGQRKRVSVALELLTRPSLLILDEPTSGLDPGYERALMQLLRDLADGGRTVIVVTHSVESLHLCDRVLVLAVGGRMAYLGPPQLAPSTLGFDDFQEMFRGLSDHPDHDWARQFASTVAHDQYVTQAVRIDAAHPPPTEQPTPARRPGWGRQLSVLVRRSLRVLAADRRALLLALASGPVLGVLILISLPDDQLGSTEPGVFRLVSQAPIVLLVLVLSANLLGTGNAVREIVKELPVFRRERAVGLSLSAYVTSKVVVIGALTGAQVAVLTPIALLSQGGPESASALGSPLLEMIVALIATAFTAMAIGLLISAVVSTTDQAMTMLPLVIVVQLILTATSVFPGSSVEALGVASSAQWGFAATSSTAELNRLNAVNRVGASLPEVDVRRPDVLLEALLEVDRGEPRWNHDASTWFGDIAIIIVMGLATLVATSALLRRHDPL